MKTRQFLGLTRTADGEPKCLPAYAWSSVSEGLATTGWAVVNPTAPKPQEQQPVTKTSAASEETLPVELACGYFDAIELLDFTRDRSEGTAQ